MCDRIIGLDLSLTATGIALPNGKNLVLKPGKRRGMERIWWLCECILGLVKDWTPHDHEGRARFYVEGYSYNSKSSHSHALGELGGAVRLMLWKLRWAEWVDVSPSTLKKFATGKGNSSKELVLVEAVKRLGYEGSDDNEADALWLRALGMEHCGQGIVKLPQTHLDALKKPLEVKGGDR